MKKAVGIWLDHHDVVIVALNDQSVEIQRFESKVEKRVRYSSASASKDGALYNERVEDMRDRDEAEGQLDHFFDEIIGYLSDDSVLLIMGPAETKTEFQKHLEIQHPMIKILNVEAADRMSDEQIIAKVRRNFELYEYAH